MEIDFNKINQWKTDEVLDFLSNKPYKNEALKELSESNNKNFVITHIAKTHEFSDLPIFVMLIRDSNSELIGIVANKINFTEFIYGLAREKKISDYQYNEIVKQLEIL